MPWEIIQSYFYPRLKAVLLLACNIADVILPLLTDKELNVDNAQLQLQRHPTSAQSSTQLCVKPLYVVSIYASHYRC